MNNDSLYLIVETLLQEADIVPFKTKFVIHDHYATHHHFDLRIKKGNVLPSWALPKARIPVEDGDKILAVRTPDHELKWMDFEGEIPKGEYGGGTVKIYDTGDCIVYKWNESDHIIVKFDGSKVKGFYSFIHTADKNYLLLRMNQTKANNDYNERI